MSEKMELTPLQQLLMLKQETVRLGSVHEAQLLQVRSYPIIIPNVKLPVTSKFDIDEKLVMYELEFKVTTKTADLMPDMKQIVSWVRTVLWDETDVVFKKGKRTLYDTRKTTVGTGSSRSNPVRDEGKSTPVGRRTRTAPKVQKRR